MVNHVILGLLNYCCYRLLLYVTYVSTSAILSNTILVDALFIFLEIYYII